MLPILELFAIVLTMAGVIALVTTVYDLSGCACCGGTVPVQCCEEEVPLLLFLSFTMEFWLSGFFQFDVTVNDVELEYKGDFVAFSVGPAWYVTVDGEDRRVDTIGVTSGEALHLWEATVTICDVEFTVYLACTYTIAAGGGTWTFGFIFRSGGQADFRLFDTPASLTCEPFAAESDAVEDNIILTQDWSGFDFCGATVFGGYSLFMGWEIVA